MSPAAASLLLFLALDLFAQTKFGTSVEVHIVNIDVVVTDKAGHRISGLTKDDFELYEDGKRQTITNFYEVNGGRVLNPSSAQSEWPAAQPRRFVFFIDNDSLQPEVRKGLFAALRRFVDTVMREGDQASLITWNRGLQIAAPLTANKAALRAAIDVAEGAPSPLAYQSGGIRARRTCSSDLDAVRGARMAMSVAYADCINSVRVEVAAMTSESRLLMNAINVAMTTAAGAEGKKVLVLAGASLPQKPGHELFQWANTLFSQMRRSFNSMNVNDMEDDRAQTAMLELLARSANANGIALYTINAPVPANEVNIQNATGVQDFGSDFLRIEDTQAAFSELAEKTGGLSFARPGDLEATLTGVAADADSYDSLGYRPADDIRRDRRIAVKAKSRDYAVRARQTYAPKSADDQLRDRVIANIYAPAPVSGWPVTLSTGAAKRGDQGSSVVAVEVSVPSTLTLLPEEGKLAGGFIVYAAVGNRQGALSTLTRSPQPVAIAPQEEAEFRKAPLSFGIDVTLKRGENLLSVAVVDQVGGAVGFARATIIAP